MWFKGSAFGGPRNHTMNGIKEIAESLGSELKRRLPKQRKRTKLALLVSTTLDVRGANLMDLAAGLPLEAAAPACATDGSPGCWATPW